MSVGIRDPALFAAISAIEQVRAAGGYGKLRSIRETNGSWVAYFASDNEKWPAYCLKVRKPAHLTHPRRRALDQLPTALEYEITARACEHFSHFPRFSNSVVHPVQLLDGHDAFLMKCARGRSLKVELTWQITPVTSPLRAAHVTSISKALGTWLRLLHTMDRPSWMPVYNTDCDRLERQVLEKAARLPEAVFRRLPLDRLLSHVHDLRFFDPHPVVCHGDFQPGNILVRGSQITVLDLAVAGFRPPEDDLAFFMVLMFAQKYRAVFGQAAGTSAFVRGLCDAFLAAYGCSGGDIWRRLRPFIVVHALERLAQMLLASESLPTLVRPFVVSRLVAWVTEELPSLLGWPRTAPERSALAWPTID